MTEIDVKRLRELAQAALWTGNWYNAGCNTLMCTYPENSGDLSGESDEIAHPCPLGLVGYMEAAQPKAILALCDRLEAAEKDAERYRAMRDFGKDGVKMKPPVEHVHAMIYSHMVGAIPASRVATGDELDRAIDAALAQRQGEGS
ncbi:hypothetical protein [Burkholderia multivorans]|uniref:hypothetical protein n=1 Tax=Burkholderia multivorans TaxID=87883 RepID=UPI001C230DA9|nr:hypothetical protein [Burkholderia multivorans]MBU9624724.1 hypothetical protein [Burkholderia multivorans]